MGGGAGPSFLREGVSFPCCGGRGRATAGDERESERWGSPSHDPCGPCGPLVRPQHPKREGSRKWSGGVRPARFVGLCSDVLKVCTALHTRDRGPSAASDAGFGAAAQARHVQQRAHLAGHGSRSRAGGPKRPAGRGPRDRARRGSAARRLHYCKARAKPDTTPSQGGYRPWLRRARSKRNRRPPS